MKKLAMIMMAIVSTVAMMSNTKAEEAYACNHGRKVAYWVEYVKSFDKPIEQSMMTTSDNVSSVVIDADGIKEVHWCFTYNGQVYLFTRG